MRIQNAKTLEDIEGLLEGYLGEVPADRYSTLNGLALREEFLELLEHDGARRAGVNVG
jgi:hypothetical protein